MIAYRIQGVVELPQSERGKYHILKMAERGGAKQVRFCGGGIAYYAHIQRDVVAPENEWCAACIRKYAAYRLKHGYRPIETVEQAEQGE